MISLESVLFDWLGQNNNINHTVNDPKLFQNIFSLCASLYSVNIYWASTTCEVLPGPRDMALNVTDTASESHGENKQPSNNYANN